MSFNPYDYEKCGSPVGWQDVKDIPNAMWLDQEGCMFRHGRNEYPFETWYVRGQKWSGTSEAGLSYNRKFQLMKPKRREVPAPATLAECWAVGKPGRATTFKRQSSTQKVSLAGGVQLLLDEGVDATDWTVCHDDAGEFVSPNGVVEVSE